MLFGRLEPGGIVNLVVKRPLEVPYYSVQEQAGSFGLTRTTVDATGPLTGDHTWLYRINAEYLHSDSFRNFVTNQNAFIGPTITFNPIEQFRFNLDAEYQNTIFVADSDDAIPAIGTRPAPIPISRYLMDPAATVVHPSRQERKFIGYDWTFDIAPNWSLTNRFGYFNVDYPMRNTNFNSICLTPGTPACKLNGVPLVFGDLIRRFSDVENHRITVSSNLDLKGKFATGSFDHSVLIGTDYFQFDQHAEGSAGVTPTVGPINIFFPTYSLSGYVKPPENFFFVRREQWKGIYAQDFVFFADDRRHLLIGGREDWAELGIVQFPSSPPKGNSSMSPRRSSVLASARLSNRRPGYRSTGTIRNPSAPATASLPPAPRPSRRRKGPNGKAARKRSFSISSLSQRWPFTTSQSRISLKRFPPRCFQAWSAWWKAKALNSTSPAASTRIGA